MQRTLSQEEIDEAIKSYVRARYGIEVHKIDWNLALARMAWPMPDTPMPVLKDVKVMGRKTRGHQNSGVRNMKTVRRLPDYAVHNDGYNLFTMLGQVSIKSQIVGIGKHLARADNIPKYSDAEIRLLIAEIEVAREKAVANADEHIAILRAILENPQGEAEQSA